MKSALIFLAFPLAAFAVFAALWWGMAKWFAALFTGKEYI